MSRYDKYNPYVGGFRAGLNAAWTTTSGPAGVTDLYRVIGVSLNANGRLVKAASALAACGIVIAHGMKAAGEIVDVMTSGEVVELDALDIQAGTAPTAGTPYYLDLTAGRLTATAPAAGTNALRVGYTVEATRLVVRTQLVQG
jgi:Uncharacterized conserved protein (DUF2190)